MFVLNYLSRPVTASGIDEAEDLATAHGLPFNRGGWKRILEKNAGFLPIEIEALAEGSIVPTSIPLVQIRSTDPQLFWLATYIETALLRAIWYPSTVATS